MTIDNYAKRLVSVLRTVNRFELRKAIAMIRRANTVFVGGNGGSAAISDHLACDFMKKKVNAISLVSNGAISTAFANDYGFENALSAQVMGLMDKGDVLLLISSSGKSKNVVNALRVAKRKGCKVIGMSGFKGGELKNESDCSLHVKSDSYGLTEDAHQSLMHYISESL